MKRIEKLYRMFTWPAIIAMLAIMIVPMVFAVYISFNHVNLLENAGKFSFAGLDNFRAFFGDARGLNSVWVTVKFVVGALLAELVLGLAVSMLLDRPFRFKSIVRSLVIIPMFMTPVVSGLVWRTFFDPSAGIISYVFKLITGSQLDMLGNRLLALPAVILVDVWQWTPFFILLCMASLDNLPDDVLEAARVEGATEWQVIWRVKLPMISPAIVTALILRAIDALKAFDVVYVMTKGGPGSATETLNMYAYTVGFTFYRIGYATAIAFMFTILVTVVLGQIIKRSKIL